MDENPYSLSNLEKNEKNDRSSKEWTFGGFILGLLIATAIWNGFYVFGPRYVTLNDGQIIETVINGYKWVEIERDSALNVKGINEYHGHKVICTIEGHEIKSTMSATTWGADCEVKNGILVCVSDGITLDNFEGE